MDIKDRYANLIMFELCKRNFNKYDDFETMLTRVKEILDDFELRIINNQPKQLSKLKRLTNP